MPQIAQIYTDFIAKSDNQCELQRNVICGKESV